MLIRKKDPSFFGCEEIVQSKLKIFTRLRPIRMLMQAGLTLSHPHKWLTKLSRLSSHTTVVCACGFGEQVTA